MLDVEPYAFPTPLETGFEQGLPAFLSGKAAMIEFWTDLGVNAQDPKVSQIIDKWDVTQMPVGGSNTKHRASLNAGFGLAISAGSKNPDAAWELVQFGCSPGMNLSQMVTLAPASIRSSSRRSRARNTRRRRQKCRRRRSRP
jgi:multiple sugar transport system substrate-binding protein